MKPALVAALSLIAVAPAATAATLPYLSGANLRSEFVWSGPGTIDAITALVALPPGSAALGPGDAIAFDPAETVWRVDAPPGGGYATVGGFIESASALSNWSISLNGVALIPTENGISEDAGVVDRYFYAGPLMLGAGENIFAVEITVDGTGGAGGTGVILFVNDPIVLPIPLPVSGLLLTTALAGAFAARRVA